MPFTIQSKHEFHVYRIDRRQMNNRHEEETNVNFGCAAIWLTIVWKYEQLLAIDIDLWFCELSGNQLFRAVFLSATLISIHIAQFVCIVEHSDHKTFSSSLSSLLPIIFFQSRYSMKFMICFRLHYSRHGIE